MGTLFEDEDGGAPYLMREPCRHCGNEHGHIILKGGQNCVYCRGCNRYAGYNAPKSETGQTVRSLRSRPDIKPSQKTRIHTRDNNSCIICGRNKLVHDVEINVGHLISVDEGRKLCNMTDAELWDDYNLATFCEECNSGQGRTSFDVCQLYRCQTVWRNKEL